MVRYISENQYIDTINGCVLTMKREDLLHPTVSGNKYRKLKYNLEYAKKHQYESLLTFGGAFSNHIAATAAAGKQHGFKTIGIIRGEELGIPSTKTTAQNPTLAFALECGMQLHFISREQYRKKDEVRFCESLKEQFYNPYIIPEGGTNDLAIKGCEEILTDTDAHFDFVCCASGTGGTVSGIINRLVPGQKGLVFPALKGNWMKDEILKFTRNEQWDIINEYHFGGYARVNPELVYFINTFKETYDIRLDPVYTGKMMYGLFAMINDGFFPENSRILAVHTGGLQGIEGMNLRLAKKGLPLIKN